MICHLWTVEDTSPEGEGRLNVFTLGTGAWLQAYWGTPECGRGVQARALCRDRAIVRGSQNATRMLRRTVCPPVYEWFLVHGRDNANGAFNDQFHSKGSEVKLKLKVSGEDQNRSPGAGRSHVSHSVLPDVLSSRFPHLNCAQDFNCVVLLWLGHVIGRSGGRSMHDVDSFHALQSTRLPLERPRRWRMWAPPADDMNGWWDKLHPERRTRVLKAP